MLTVILGLILLATAGYGVYLRSPRAWIGVGATSVTVLAWGLLTVLLVQRGFRAGHWPLTNRYEFALCFLWALLAVYVLLEVSWGRRRAGMAVSFVALLLAIYAATRPPEVRAISPLLPILRSVWLQVHVLTAVVAYGAFAVAAGLGLMQVLGWASRAGDGSPGEAIERGIERVLALGFPWLTLSILTGAVWAQKAWGRYWGWDPKETWALITWLFYLLVLHLVPRKRWRGRRLATLALTGFALVVFAFVGLPWLVRVVRLETLHGF